MTSFFRNWRVSEFSGFCIFLENGKTDFYYAKLFFIVYLLRQIVFHCLGENTCSLQLALKNTAPDL